MVTQYHNVFKNRIAQWLTDWCAMLKVYYLSPELENLGKKDFIENGVKYVFSERRPMGSFPFICSQVLRPIADLNREEFPQAADRVNTNFYVDNLLDSFYTEAEATQAS
jgi:hypothetical protein